MATIQDVILNNTWKSSSFELSTDVNRLFSSGILTAANPQARAIIDALDEDNLQSTVKLGLTNYEWAEMHLGDASDDEATSQEQVLDEYNVKTFYGDFWWSVRTIQRDLMNETRPVALVLQRVGEYWATAWNKYISATVSGMSDISEITVGSDSTEFSRQLVLNARSKKGDMGYGKLATMYMSAITLHDILSKQAAGVVITEDLIKETYGTTTIVVDGVTTVVTDAAPTYKYNGTTPIVVDDSMSSGVISLIEDGAFAFYQKDLAQPLMYQNSPKSGNGVGKEEWGTKQMFIIHPIGFDFVGVYDTDYASRSGLTLAELEGGGLYELTVDAKLSPITNIKVKIGS